jgi:hypothetical protein
MVTTCAEALDDERHMQLNMTISAATCPSRPRNVLGFVAMIRLLVTIYEMDENADWREIRVPFVLVPS